MFAVHHNLLFDLDQTLLDFHASEHFALKAVMARNGQDITEDDYAFFKQTNKGLWLEFEKGAITKTELFERRFGRLFEARGCDTSSIDMLKVNDDFIDCMSHNGFLMDGVTDFLEKVTAELPDAGIYVITNGVSRNALGRIASTGLDKYISRVFVSEELGYSKPAREYFDIVTEAVGEPAESYIVIGDSLTSDMLGAKNAHLTSCWFTAERNTEEAMKEYSIDYTASSFDELFEVISAWAALSSADKQGL